MASERTSAWRNKPTNTAVNAMPHTRSLRETDKSDRVPPRASWARLTLANSSATTGMKRTASDSVSAMSSTGTFAKRKGPMSIENPANNSVDVDVRHTTMLAATRRIMRRAACAPLHAPSIPGSAAMENTIANNARTNTGASGISIRVTGMRATAMEATVNAADTHTTHHEGTAKTTMENTSNSTIFTAA